MRMRFFLGFALLCAVTSASAQLTASDVQRIIKQGATRAAQISPHSVIAVTDREGFVLGVWNVRGGEPSAIEIETAISKAGTGAFLSSNAEAFTTRTAGFIIQEHFPPGIRNTAPGPLVGVGFSSLPFSDVNRFKQFFGPLPPPPPGISPGTIGLPIPGTSLSGSPGGLPLYKNNRLVGGVGITGDGTEGFVSDYDKDEDVGLAAQTGFRPSSSITANNVYINGISLPYARSNSNLPSPLILPGNAAAGFPIQSAPPPFPYPVATFGGVSGQIRQPIMGDPLAGLINGQQRLTAAEVTGIIELAADRARTTRAGIRLPIGSQAEVFITVVNNPNAPGVSPTVLGAFRTGDATIFSWDVAVQKGRTALGFSNNATAYSTRTVGFLAQTHYPPGIDPQPPGPFFGLQEGFSTPPPNPNFPNGITIFPGGFPLYRNGQLIGAIGVSGDGVDQDDLIAASGTETFPAPDHIRADEFNFGGTRLPYAKFPRDPTGVNPVTPVVLPPIAALSSVAGELVNISSRVEVQLGERLMIGGFIINGTQPKRVMIRGLGPSLANAGISNPLAHPVLELHSSTGAILARNEGWRTTQPNEIAASGLAPGNDSEAAMIQTLNPGAYTVGLTGQNGGTGVGLLEVFDLAQSSSVRLANISTRAMAGTGNNVMIGGFIVRGGGKKVLVRALGPSLAARGIAQPLADPTLEVRDGNGALVAANANWRDTQAMEIQQLSLAPEDDREAAVLIALPPGAYTATLRGSGGGVGVGLLEIFRE